MNIHSLYSLFFRHFRKRRMLRFARMFSLTGSQRIVDVGGTPDNWLFLPPRARPRVVIVNTDPAIQRKPGFDFVVADGCRLPFRDLSFDIAFSNSVIEHVGSLETQKTFAAALSRVARRFFVQTPYRWFFIEPHLIAPFLHYFPRPVQVKLIRWCSLWGWITRPSLDARIAKLNETRLLSAFELKSCFPHAQLVRERFFGVTKALIAMRNT